MVFDCAPFTVAEFLLIRNQMIDRVEQIELIVFAGKEGVGLVDRL